MVNSCFLNLLSLYNQGQPLQLWIDRDHYRHYRNKPAGVSLKYKKVIQPKKSNRVLWILKLLSEVLLITNIVFKAKRASVKIVFFSSLSPLGNWYLSVLIPILNRTSKFVIVLHGELELAKSSKWTKRIENIYGKLLRSSFRTKISNRRFLILGSAVLRNVLKNNLLARKDVICIEHPYIFEENPHVISHAGDLLPQIVFGQLGVAKLAKQYHLIFKLAEEMKDFIEDGIIRFEIVGQVFEEIRPFINPYVSFQETDAFISRNEYDNKGRSLSYALFFYDEQSYEFTSSGAIMDAIAYEKPIIGFNIKPFSNIFGTNDKCNPGYLFEDFESLLKSMKKIVANHQSNYLNMVGCIKGKKQLFTVEAQFDSFKQQLDDLVNL